MRTLISKADTKPKGFLLDAESVPVLDISGVYALESLRGELAAQGIVLGIARAGGLFRLMLERAGVAQTIGTENLFPTVHTGARTFQQNQKSKEETFQVASYNSPPIHQLRPSDGGKHE